MADVTPSADYDAGGWQAETLTDLHPRGISDHGGGNAALMAAAQEHVNHLNDECPGGLNSRIKFNGKWVDQPVLSDGRQADGSMAVYALPRWWVWR